MENEKLMAAIQRLQSDTATLLSVVERQSFTTLSANDSNLQQHFEKLEAKLDLSIGVLRAEFERLQKSVAAVDSGIGKVREDIADLTS